jgi:hypothetical protein
MPNSDPGSVGPYEKLSLAGGGTVPLYLITFDKEGRCQSPLTLASLVAQVDTGRYTDVHVFSHGWNNVFRDAVGLYRQFFGHYFSQRDQRGLNDPKRYRPLAVGIIWPSTLLVLPWESTPKIAAVASSPGLDDDEAAADRDALEGVAGAVRPSDLHRLYEFAERGPTLNPAEARELANILLPIYQNAAANEDASPEIAGADSGGVPKRVTAEQLLALWQELSPGGAADNREPGFAPDQGSDPAAGMPMAAQPLTAGFLSWLDPRGPIRVASVLQMKDRAGTVGAKGVGPHLIQKLLAMQKARIHLIGHSYGAKVILSSLCCHPVSARAASLLLLEPAISYLCFGRRIDGKALNGGYRDALNRVEQPILSTFSACDIPLRKLFHLAVIRGTDWGEQRIAGLPPSRFAALGGFGPGGLEAGEGKTIEMLAPPAKYPSGEAGVRIYGVDGSKGKIKGHGNVATEFTAWAHLNLVSGPELHQEAQP